MSVRLSVTFGGGGGGGREGGQEGGGQWGGKISQMDMMECLCGHRHMEWLGGIRLQSFLTEGHFVYPCNAGYSS